MRVLLLICLFAILGNYVVKAQSNTQDYVFKVLASSGTNTVLKSTAPAKPLKTGNKITKEDKITLAPNSFLGLVHKSGKTLELKTPGTYAATDLSAKVSASQATFNQKYVDFVIGEMTKTEKDDVHKNHQKNMGVEGKVERGQLDIDVLIPQENDVYVLGTKPVIFWHPHHGTRTYKISVVDMFDEILYSATTVDTTFTLDLAQEGLKTKDTYLIKITSVDKPHASHDKYNIKKLDAKKAVAVNKSMAELKGGTEETSLHKILQASFLEENKLYVEALLCYRQAIQMQPHVSDYQIAYQQFLRRHNLMKQ